MKRILFTILMCLIFVSAKSEIHTYLGTSYAVADVSRRGEYTWSRWYECDVIIVINTNNNIVAINSREPQAYKIYRYEGNKYDDGGGYQAIFDVIDSEGDYGQLRVRIMTDYYGNITNAQIYIDFKNVAWVYNIREI